MELKIDIRVFDLISGPVKKHLKVPQTWLWRLPFCVQQSPAAMFRTRLPAMCGKSVRYVMGLPFSALHW